MKKSIAKFFALFAASTIVINASAASNASADEFAAAYQQFSFDLFDQVEKKASAEDNVVVSPLSAWFALGMLQQGAATTTLAEINRALRLSPDFADLAQCNQQLIEQLMAPGEWEDWYEDGWKSVLELANSFWADDQITCLDSYKEALQTYYQAEYAQLDLQQLESLDRVDAWVNEKTHGTIPSLRLVPNEYMQMLLVNALYFKATWHEIAFDEYETTASPFTTAGGEVRQVPMMHACSRMNYGETDGYQIVRIPLGVERRYSMMFFLGGQEAAAFSPTLYDKAQDVMQREDVKLSLPRFKADGETELTKPLQAMGMHEVFTPKADLSRTSPGRLFVSLVKQLTHVAVDEKGVEASAATVILEEGTGLWPEPEWKVLNIDHPFYFCIDDQLSHKLLFLGHIQDIEVEDDPSAGVVHPSVLPKREKYYDVMGRRQACLKKGLNVVNDGGRQRIVSVQ